MSRNYDLFVESLNKLKQESTEADTEPGQIATQITQLFSENQIRADNHAFSKSLLKRYFNITEKTKPWFIKSNASQKLKVLLERLSHNDGDIFEKVLIYTISKYSEVHLNGFDMPEDKRVVLERQIKEQLESLNNGKTRLEERWHCNHEIEIKADVLKWLELHNLFEDQLAKHRVQQDYLGLRECIAESTENIRKNIDALTEINHHMDLRLQQLSQSRSGNVDEGLELVNEDHQECAVPGYLQSILETHPQALANHLSEFMQLLQWGADQISPVIKQIKGKTVLLVVGGTNVGKSTIINYLCGHRLLRRQNSSGEILLDVESCEMGQVARIGHAPRVSATLLPEIFQLQTDLYICDTAGFYDTRGELLRLLQAIHINTIISNAKNIKILVILQDASLKENRGIAIESIANKMEKIFGLNNRDSLSQSVKVFINKVPPYITDRVAYINRHKLNQVSFSKNNVVCVDPLNEAARESLLRNLVSMPAYDIGSNSVELELDPHTWQCCSMAIEHAVAEMNIAIEALDYQKLLKLISFFRCFYYFKTFEYTHKYKSVIKTLKDELSRNIQNQSLRLIREAQYQESRLLLSRLNDFLMNLITFPEIRTLQSLSETLAQENQLAISRHVVRSFQESCECLFQHYFKNQGEKAFIKHLYKVFQSLNYPFYAHQFHEIGEALLTYELDPSWVSKVKVFLEQLSLLKEENLMKEAELQLDEFKSQLDIIYKEVEYHFADKEKESALQIFKCHLHDLEEQLCDLAHSQQKQLLLDILSKGPFKNQFNLLNRHFSVLSMNLDACYQQFKMKKLSNLTFLDNKKRLKIDQAREEIKKALLNCFFKVHEQVKDLIDQEKIQQEQALKIARKEETSNIAREVTAKLDDSDFHHLSKKLIKIYQLDETQLDIKQLERKALSFIEDIKQRFDKSEFSGLLGVIKKFELLTQEVLTFNQKFDCINKNKFQIGRLINDLSGKIEQLVQRVSNDLLVCFSELEKGSDKALEQADLVRNYFSLVREFSDSEYFKTLFLEKTREIELVYSKEIDRVFATFPSILSVATANKIAFVIAGLDFLVAEINTLSYKNRPIQNRLDQQMRDFIVFVSNPEKINLADSLMHALMALTADKKLGTFASNIIDGHPIFLRAKIAIFNDKSKTRDRQSVFREFVSSEQQLDNAWKTYLESQYYAFYVNYDKQVSYIIDHQQSSKAQALSSYVRDAKALAKSGSVRQQFGKLLAYIFCVQSALDIYRGGVTSQKDNNFWQPHATQVLSVLLMLGNEASLRNHFLQIKTGEGKSVILAGTSIALALQGKVVDIACYSHYLAQRDKKEFAELINTFGLSEAITYAKFGRLIETRLKQECSGWRTAVKAFLKSGSLESSLIDSQQGNSKPILLVDEVDIFFSEHFLGKSYHPITVIRDKNFISWIKWIWEHRDEINHQDQSFIIDKHEYLQKFLSDYPYIKGELLSQLVEEVKLGLKKVKKKTYHYHVSELGIGYEDSVSGDISYSTYCGYSTAFAYLNEQQRYREKNPEVWDNIDEQLGFSLSVGNMPYVNLLPAYQFILGTTATFNFSRFQAEFIEGEHCCIKMRTAMPSPFEKKTLPPTPSISVLNKFDEKDEDSYFYVLKRKIEERIHAKQAVLVVFKNDQRLANFQAFVQNTGGYKIENLKPVAKLMASSAPYERDNMIAEAARQGQITYLTRVFGRGSDFVCRDGSLCQAGGVHVIQTFFSTDISEEVQIKGRTCRQDDPGSYELILWRSDLEKHHLVNEDEELPQHIYSFLNEKRRELTEANDRLLEGELNTAKKRYEDTHRFFKFVSAKTAVDPDRHVKLLADLQK